jgi:DNA-binding MarR family transcriptional regulator
MLAGKQLLAPGERRAAVADTIERDAGGVAPAGLGDSDDVSTRLRAAIGRVSRRLRRTPAAGSLTATQISVLFGVVRHGPMPLAALAELEAINPTMLSRVIGGLTEVGLLERTTDPGDRRAALVAATPSGRRVRERIQREQSDALALHLTALSPRDREAIVDALPALEALAEQLQ